MVEVSPSPSESARFGRSVGRLALTEDSQVATACALLASDAHDLVILRHPSSMVRAFAELAKVPGRRAIYADTLLYFRWVDDGCELSPSRPWLGRDAIEEGSVAAVVEATFAGYLNHYAANPRLDATQVAVGYAEWATNVATNPVNVLVANSVDGEIAGLAVIDASHDEWDVVLAGVAPTHRGGGLYGDLMTSVMAEARAAGQRSVLISTQSHNIQVMRTWERLGWRIISATVTVHLERC